MEKKLVFFGLSDRCLAHCQDKGTCLHWREYGGDYSYNGRFSFINRRGC